eukprot:6214570-Pleurochrysis_carterae.AAC.4
MPMPRDERILDASETGVLSVRGSKTHELLFTSWTSNSVAWPNTNGVALPSAALLSTSSSAQHPSALSGVSEEQLASWRERHRQADVTLEVKEGVATDDVVFEAESVDTLSTLSIIRSSSVNLNVTFVYLLENFGFLQLCATFSPIPLQHFLHWTVCDESLRARFRQLIEELIEFIQRNPSKNRAWKAKADEALAKKDADGPALGI